MKQEYLEYLSKGETIQKLLDEVDLNNYEFKKIERTYTVGDDRFGFIAQMTDNVSGCLCRIIIDFKHGEPTCQQLYDLTYDLGNDCDHKIVHFDSQKNVADRSDPSACELLNENFAELLRSYGESIYLIKSRSTIWSDGEVGFEFRKRDGYGRYPKLRNPKLPTKRAFQEAEFWGYYHDSVPHIDTSYEFSPKGWIYPYIETYGLKISPSWTDKGLFMNITTDTNHELLEWLLAKTKQELKEFAEEFQEKFEYLEGIPSCGARIVGEKDKSGVLEIVVLMTNMSFKEVIYSNPREKQQFAEMVFSLHPNFWEFIEELVDRWKTRKKVKNK